jgi:hypothetical protein
MAFVGTAAPAAAQSAVGTGPLTTTLTDTEPTSGVLSWGPIKAAPGIVVPAAGYDSNVFDEAVDPKHDYAIVVAPDISVFSRSRFLQLSAYGGGNFMQFNTYTSENANGYSYRGRADFLLSRMRPFVAGGQNKTRERANGEIDTRADRRETEVSGGLAFDFYAHSLIYAAAYRLRTDFTNAFEEGVSLDTSLDRDSTEYSLGIKTDLTPLAALTLSGGYQEDKFRADPLRNAKGARGTASLKVGAEAVFSGTISGSYTDLRPEDPKLEGFRGFTGSAAIIYPVLEIGRITLQGMRGIQYSFDSAEGYFVENTVILSYTHLLPHGLDAQIRGGTSLFDYGFSKIEPAHKDTLDTVLGGIGYNLKNRTRISANYEYSRRRSPAFAARNYDRRRIYMSWTVGF